MHRRTLILIAFMMLMVVTVTPIKVKAQSMVHFSLVLPLIVTGVGNNETAEVHFVTANNPRTPQPSEDPLPTYNFLIEISHVSDSSCRQTFEKVLLESTVFGLPMLSIFKGFDQVAFVTINDGTTVEKHDLLPCFDDGRVAVLVAVPVPRSLADQLAADPDTVPIGVWMPKAAQYSIVGPNGETSAASGGGIANSGGSLTLINPEPSNSIMEFESDKK
jgi:hypothetical protein